MKCYVYAFALITVWHDLHLCKLMLHDIWDCLDILPLTPMQNNNSKTKKTIHPLPISRHLQTLTNKVGFLVNLGHIFTLGRCFYILITELPGSLLGRWLLPRPCYESTSDLGQESASSRPLLIAANKVSSECSLTASLHNVCGWSRLTVAQLRICNRDRMARKTKISTT